MITLINNWLNRNFSDPQIIILSLMIIIGFFSIFMLGEMLAPVFAGVVIAYLLEGIVNGMQQCHVPRFPSVIIVFCVFLACMMLLTIGLLPALSRQIGQFVQQLPAIIAKGQKELIRLPERYPDFISEQQLRNVLDLLTSEITNLFQHIFSVSMASVKGIISVLIYLLLVPLLVFSFLKDKDKILNWITGLLPKERGLANKVWQEVNLQIGNYIRGKIWEILIVWGVTYATFSFMGLQFSMLLALFVGLSVIVPYIGATVMFFPVCLIAYFQWGFNSEFVTIFVALSVIQILDGNLLAPILLSEVVNLHPVAIIVAVLVFGGLWGIWGLFFAIPLATLVNAVLNVWIFHSKNTTISRNEKKLINT